MILQVKEIANQNVKIAPQRKTMNSKIAPGKKKIILSLAGISSYDSIDRLLMSTRAKQNRVADSPFI